MLNVFQLLHFNELLCIMKTKHTPTLPSPPCHSLTHTHTHTHTQSPSLASSNVKASRLKTFACNGTKRTNRDSIKLENSIPQRRIGDNVVYISSVYVHRRSQYKHIHVYIHRSSEEKSQVTHRHIYIYVICSGTVRQTPFGGKANNTKYL